MLNFGMMRKWGEEVGPKFLQKGKKKSKTEDKEK